MCFECLLQSEFLGVCDILVRNDVVMGVRATQGPEAVAQGKICWIWRQKLHACLFEDKSLKFCEPQLSHSQNGDNKASPIPAVIKEHYFKSFAMND